MAEKNLNEETGCTTSQILAAIEGVAKTNRPADVITKLVKFSATLDEDTGKLKSGDMPDAIVAGGDWLISDGTAWEHIPASIGKAMSNALGTIKLAGDLGGDANAPTVTGLKGVPFIGTLSDGQVWAYSAADGGMIPTELGAVVPDGYASFAEFTDAALAEMNTRAEERWAGSWDANAKSTVITSNEYLNTVGDHQTSAGSGQLGVTATLPMYWETEDSNSGKCIIINGMGGFRTTREVDISRHGKFIIFDGGDGYLYCWRINGAQPQLWRNKGAETYDPATALSAAEYFTGAMPEFPRVR